MALKRNLGGVMLSVDSFTISLCSCFNLRGLLLNHALFYLNDLMSQNGCQMDSGPKPSLTVAHNVYQRFELEIEK